MDTEHRIVTACAPGRSACFRAEYTTGGGSVVALGDYLLYDVGLGWQFAFPHLKGPLEEVVSKLAARGIQVQLRQFYPPLPSYVPEVVIPMDIDWEDEL